MLLAAIVAAALTFAPLGAPVGTAVVAHAAHVAPNTRFDLVWHTGQAHWRVENGKFLGIVAPDAARVVASGTSDADGALTLRFSVPEDFGYIHDVELRSADAVVAHQGFTVIPHLTISPSSGPPGTPITVTMTGVGYRFYQTVWHLMYDGAQTGWLSAITTHGTARVTLPASGEPGMHTLQAIEGPTAPYLNGQQSPNAQPLIPQVLAQTFRLVAGPPRLPASAVAQAPQRATEPPRRDAAGPSLATSFRSGTVGSPLVITGHGFAPQASIAVDWETVVGNRLSGTGWETQLRPFVRAVADANGDFTVRAQTPDDLGGDHRVVAHPAGSDQPQAAAAYRIVPSIAAIAPSSPTPGQTITLRLKGVGWTETANTYTVVMDNAMFGYGCGFNSQGDVTIRVRAPGRAGWHFVDFYPTIYTGQILGPGTPPNGATVNGSYFLLPMLNVPDHPGEQLPAFHLAFFVRGSS
ncbi:MAG TPA: hypothetical protein VN905_09880 [Candidatus Binatia bacterium]|nr:hypothetical protein [Candidatus Binatia bacterium]